MDAPGTLHRDPETETPAVDLHLEKVESLSPRAEIVNVPGTVEVRVLGMEKALEDMFPVLLGDPDPAIFDGDDDIPVIPREGYLDEAAVRGVFHGIF
jgi:hypothetical protein